MNTWEPDTCYCKILYTIPNSNDGKWLIRCRLHQNTRNINDLWEHNKANKIQVTDYTGTGKTKIEKPSARKRVDDLKETTRR